MLPGRIYTFDDIAAMIRRRAWVIAIPMFVAGVVTAAVLTRMPDQFRSDTLILVVPQRVPESYVKATVTTRIEDRLQSISQQLLSRTRLERTILDFNLYPRERESTPMEDVVERMRSNIQVQIVKGDAFRVSYAADTPTLAQKVTERLSSLFIEENLRDREVLADATNEFLDTQLADARRRLIEQEKQLEQYRILHAGQLPSQLQSNLQVTQNLQMQLQGMMESANRDRDRRLVLERMILELDSGARDTATARDPADAEDDRSPAEQLEALRRALTAMEVRLRAQHPDVVHTKRLIQELEQRVAAKADAAGPAVARGPSVESPQRRRVDALKAEIQTLDLQIAEKEQRRRGIFEQIARYDARIAAVPARESELASLTRDYETLQKVYTDLLSKREQSKVAANLERRQIGEQFTVLDPARLPEKPFSPNRPLLLLIGLVAGLALGSGLAGWLEFRDTSFRSETDIRSTLALPVLASVPVRPSVEQPGRRLRDIALSATASSLAWLRGWRGSLHQGSRFEMGTPPKVAGRARRPSEVTLYSDVETPAQGATAANADQRVHSNLVVAADAGDAYCRLAAELHQVSQSRPLTTLMITSAEPGEGKSLTAANLALALSTSYRKRVLLVDADLRQPSLQRLFGADDAPGLSDWLLTGGDTPAQPQRLSDKLSLLPAGYPEPNPLAMLTSTRMKDLVLDQAQRFDWVIIDAPPLAVFPDAHLLASLANGVVLVVGAGHTPLGSVESAVKMLDRERIVGVVLNRATPARRTYYDRQARRAGLIQRCSRLFCRA